MERKPGDKIGPYELVAPIGKGGMGEVWKGRDTRLHRDVAIKFCSSRFSDRFLREARAIAALNHPNICTLHDIGPDYLVMEYIEGAPPRGPIVPAEAVRLALGIATALETAHGKGITHRDLKPANVLVTQSGVKLLDFGLARVNGNGGVDLADAPTDLSVAGAVMGTVAYMSPEQAQGKPADARSDIFSFGLVIYELLSGRQAFAGNSVVDTLAAIIRDEPGHLDAPANLSGIVTRCLHKSPASRFQTIGEVRAALEQVSAAGPEEKQPSIAVLPFANLSADKENEYFSDGLSEEILNALSQVDGLQVAARASSFFFKGKGVEMSEIGARLRVSAVLDGSVRRSGNRVRVTVQLVDVTRGFQLWSERYDRQMEDIFEVQDEIARAITEKLKLTLGAGARQSTKNPEAWDLYLKGRHFLHQRSPATLRMAIEAFEQTIGLDPRNALAYAGLADCHGLFRAYGWVRTEDARPRAHAAVTQAMQLDPSLWEVNFSQAIYTYYFERDWRAAEPHFRKAAGINPRSSLAQSYYGVFLAAMGNSAEAVERIAIGRQLDPLSPFIYAVGAAAMSLLRKFDDAERMARHSVALQPGYLFGLLNLGNALCGLGRGAEAVDVLEQVVAVSRAPIYLGFLALACGCASRADEAGRLFGELEDRATRGEYFPPFVLLSIYTGMRDLPAMRRTLAAALADSSVLFLAYVIALFPEEARGDPEIQQLLRQI